MIGKVHRRGINRRHTRETLEYRARSINSVFDVVGLKVNLLAGGRVREAERRGKSPWEYVSTSKHPSINHIITTSGHHLGERNGPVFRMAWPHYTGSGCGTALVSLADRGPREEMGRQRCGCSGQTRRLFMEDVFVGLHGHVEDGTVTMFYEIWTGRHRQGSIAGFELGTSHCIASDLSLYSTHTVCFYRVLVPPNCTLVACEF